MYMVSRVTWVRFVNSTIPIYVMIVIGIRYT
jgi:hypothetical protein